MDKNFINMWTSVVWLLISFGHVLAMECPCKEAWMCNVVQDKGTKQVAFYAATLVDFDSFDLSKLTTVIVYENEFVKYDSGWAILCKAHANHVKVLIAMSISKEQLGNPEARANITSYYLAFAKKHSLDGANINYEQSTEDPKLQYGFTDIVNKSAAVFHEQIPGSIIQTDVFWIPNADRDTFALAKYTDYMYIMAYDQQEQRKIFVDCAAHSNAPFYRTEYGLHAYLQMGVPAHKVILGTAWYGYAYKCLRSVNNTCYIGDKVDPLHCSQPSWRKVYFGEIMDKWANNAVGGIMWDKLELSPYFTYKNESDHDHLYQLRYDDVQSLKLKYSLADKWKINGVGAWKADALNYTKGNTMTEEMWNAVPNYNKRL